MCDRNFWKTWILPGLKTHLDSSRSKDSKREAKSVDTVWWYQKSHGSTAPQKTANPQRLGNH